MKYCEECGTELEDGLEECARCEKKARRKKQYLGLLIILLITGIPAMSFLGIFF